MRKAAGEIPRPSFWREKFFLALAAGSFAA
jgi:hypothetical protein